MQHASLRPAGEGRCSFRFLPAALAVVVTIAVWNPPARAEPLPAGWGKALSPEQRLALECPDKAVQGDFARPSEIWPFPDVPFDLTYSAGSDLVRLVGGETEANVALGAGDDVVLLYDAGAGMSLRADSGADTILLCSMEDLDIGFTPGTENLARDEGRDVIIIDSPVFVSVPAGMRRIIMIHGFDAAADTVVVRAPRELMEAREILNIGGIRIGNVLVTINAAVGSSEVDFDSESVVLVADGNLGPIARQDMQPVTGGPSTAGNNGGATRSTDVGNPDGVSPANMDLAASSPQTKVTVPWAPGCEFLQLYRTREPTEISGVAPAGDVVCYAIKPVSGSEMSVEVAEGRNVIFSISDLVDAVDRHAFRASGYGYRIEVGQLMRSADPEPYRLIIRGGESTEPPVSTAPVEADLREKVMDFVGTSYDEAGLTPQSDLEVDITPADLDGDGNPEALVMVRSFLDCGSRGCTGYILELNGPAARRIGHFLGQSLEAAESVTGGWRDVLLDGRRLAYRSGEYVVAGTAGGSARPDNATVFSAQERLAALGYDPGPADGVYGRKTRAAIEAFLADRGLRREPRVDAGLMAALDAATGADAADFEAEQDPENVAGTVAVATASVALEDFLAALFPDCRGSPAFNQFRSTLHERYGYLSDGSRIDPGRQVAIPGDIRPFIGPAAATNEGEYTRVVVPLTGSYRSLAVSALEFAFGNENGINAMSVHFAETPDRVRAILGKEVEEAARTMELLAQRGEAIGTIAIGSVGDRGTLACDQST